MAASSSPFASVKLSASLVQQAREAAQKTYFSRLKY